MNELVTKFLFVGDKFTLLRQPGFTYSACGPFTKNKEKKQENNDVFIKANWIKLVFNMKWFIEILKI